MTGSITEPDHRLSARSVLSWDRCQWIFPPAFYLLLSPLIETCNSSAAIITLMLSFCVSAVEVAPSVPPQYLTPASAPIFPFLTNELRVLLWPVNINHGEAARQWLTAPAEEAQNEMKVYNKRNIQLGDWREEGGTKKFQKIIWIRQSNDFVISGRKTQTVLINGGWITPWRLFAAKSKDKEPETFFFVHSLWIQWRALNPI